GRPHWRAPLLLGDALVTGRAVLDVAGGGARPWPFGPRALSEVAERAAHAETSGDRLCLLSHGGEGRSWQLGADAVDEACRVVGATAVVAAGAACVFRGAAGALTACAGGPGRALAV